MEYLIGVILAAAVAALAAAVKLDRDRSFYPTLLIVIASYYVLFAVMGASKQILGIELAVASAFLVLAIIGFQKSPALVAAAIIGHGLFDLVHSRFIDDPGVPQWWPGFCATVDVVLGAWVAFGLTKPRQSRIPPVVTVLVVAGFMWLSSRSLPAFGFVLPALNPFAAIFAFGGAVISALGVIAFKRAGTTVNPLKPDSSSSLVLSSVYGFTRNPMYLGFLMVLAGWALYLSHALAILFVPVFVLYMNRFQIDPEERALTARFGPEFVSYKLRVRRWI